MSTPHAIADLDLTPPPGRVYFQTEREWREEFIYFLMVDRFHDDQARQCPPSPGRAVGVATPDDFYGGTIKGITRNLDYIAGLGCTAIWRLREQRRRLSRLQHQQLPERRPALRHETGPDRPRAGRPRLSEERPAPSPARHPGRGHQSLGRQLDLPGSGRPRLRERPAVRLRCLAPQRSTRAHRAAEPRLLSPARQYHGRRVGQLSREPARRPGRAQGLRQRR